MARVVSTVATTVLTETESKDVPHKDMQFLWSQCTFCMQSGHDKGEPGMALFHFEGFQNCLKGESAKTFIEQTTYSLPFKCRQSYVWLQFMNAGFYSRYLWLCGKKNILHILTSTFSLSHSLLLLLFLLDYQWRTAPSNVFSLNACHQWHKTSHVWDKWIILANLKGKMKAFCPSHHSFTAC